MKYAGYLLVAFIVVAGGWWLLGSDRGQNMAQNTEGGAMDTMDASDAAPADAASMMSAEADVVIDMRGANFAFSTKEIRVKEGDVVTINFTADDMQHDWVVDAFDARTAIVPAGQSSSVTFVADKKGTFEYYCSVGQHRANGMVGTLIVE
jgi:plastocyanin